MYARHGLGQFRIRNCTSSFQCKSTARSTTGSANLSAMLNCRAQLMALRFSAHLLSTRFLFTLNSRELLSIPKLPALFMALSCFRSSSRVVGKLSSWRRREWVRAWARAWARVRGTSAGGNENENGHQDGRQSTRPYLLLADSGQNSIGPLRQIEVVALRHPPGSHRGKLRIGRGHHPDRAHRLVDEAVRRCGAVAYRVNEPGQLKLLEPPLGDTVGHGGVDALQQLLNPVPKGYSERERGKSSSSQAKVDDRYVVRGSR